MIDREAIECFESDCENCSVKDECKRLKEKGKLVCRNTNAITALKEREERGKGCSSCTTVHNGKTLFKGSGMMWGYKFCPHCGRPLKGAQDE